MAEQQERMERREREVLKFCDELPERFGAVVIGGYAVSALSVPRYSADMDLVCPAGLDDEVNRYMLDKGFLKTQERKDIEQNYGGAMACYVRGKNWTTIIDFLFGSVIDRGVKVPISYETVRNNSEILPLRGVSGVTSKPLQVASREMLFALKIQPFRQKDQEDLAALSLGEMDVLKIARILRPVASKSNMVITHIEDGIALAGTELFRHRMTARFPGINRSNVISFLNRFRNVLSGLREKMD